MALPKSYRTAPGHDGCDRCFRRERNGEGCELHGFGKADGYKPNGLCDDFAPRSMSQPYTEDKPATELAEAEAELAQAINGVEVLKVGTWNGIKFAKSDLQAMADAFGEVGFAPPVKLGHSKAEDAPAWGWVNALRVDGDVLVADFRDVPDELVDQIKEKRYDAVSAEIWQDLKRDKKKFPTVLKAVALLGAHPPAVSGLKPPSESLALLAEAAGTRTIYTIAEPHKEIPGMTTKPDAPPADPGAGVNLAEQNAALEAQLAELNRKLAAAEAEKGKAGTVALELQRTQERLATLEKVTAETLEQRRQERITTLAQGLKVPSLRPHFAALADLATSNGAPREVTFAASGDAAKAVPTDPWEVLEDMRTRINGRVDILFREEVRGGDMAEARADLVGHQDAGMALAAKVNELMASEGLPYDKAKARVFAAPANRELVQAYSQPKGGN